ncbi:MAG: GAF domain-containing protein [Armatimonadetes bacterium]|nr:GAF domain-containing protein [Armatimonadota bacterium]
MKTMAGNEHALEIAARLITARAAPEQVLDAVLNAALDATQATQALIALVDRRNGELAIQRVAGEGWTPEKREERLRTGSGVHEGIVGLVATTGQPYLTGDVSQDPHYYPLIEGTRSELAVPLVRSRDRVAGVLNLESSLAGAFTEEDVRVASALAALATVAVSMAEHHRREHELAETARKLNRWGSTEDLLMEFTEAAARILQAYDGSLFILQPDGRTLLLAASHGPLRDQIGRASYQVGEGVTGSVAEHGYGIRLEDVASDPHWIGKYQEIPHERIAGFLAVPVVADDGRVEGVLRVIRDKTPASLPNAFDEDDEVILATLASQVAVLLQRSRLLQRLVQTERLAAWGQLSARAAHIIGNKVFAMKGAMGELRHLLEASDQCSPECGELIEMLSRSLGETDAIIQSFKDFVASRDIKRTSVNLNQMVGAAVRRVHGAAEGIRFVTHLAADMPSVPGDASRLGETLDEVIQNAIAWQPEGGEVRLTTSVVTSKEAADLAKVGRASQYVRVDVEDEGPGVPAEMRAHIFEPFVSTRGRGLGLGLPICREVVRAHGGEIVELGTGRGAHFVILLPAGDQEGVP